MGDNCVAIHPAEPILGLSLVNACTCQSHSRRSCAWGGHLKGLRPHAFRYLCALCGRLLEKLFLTVFVQCSAPGLISTADKYDQRRNCYDAEVYLSLQRVSQTCHQRRRFMRHDSTSTMYRRIVLAVFSPSGA